jgi:hypothetical protein
MVASPRVAVVAVLPVARLRVGLGMLGGRHATNEQCAGNERSGQAECGAVHGVPLILGGSQLAASSYMRSVMP